MIPWDNQNKHCQVGLYRVFLTTKFHLVLELLVKPPYKIVQGWNHNYPFYSPNKRSHLLLFLIFSFFHRPDPTNPNHFLLALFMATETVDQVLIELPLVFFDFSMEFSRFLYLVCCKRSWIALRPSLAEIWRKLGVAASRDRQILDFVPFAWRKSCFRKRHL